MIWVLKGPGPEMQERWTEAQRNTFENHRTIAIASGSNTREEADNIASHSIEEGVIRVVTSAYHVPRATLTILAALRQKDIYQPLHVWGTGTVTNEQAQREAVKLAEAQAKGHALRWEDV